jgi:hypothetical protein
MRHPGFQVRSGSAARPEAARRRPRRPGQSVAWPIAVSFVSSRNGLAVSHSSPLFSSTFPDRSLIFACRTGAGQRRTKTESKSPFLVERGDPPRCFLEARGPGEGLHASFGDISRLGCLTTVKRLRTPSTLRALRRGRGRFHRKLCRSVSS